MNQTRGPLGRHITPNLDEARLARQRDAVIARLRAPAARRWPLFAAPLVLLALLVVSVVMLRAPSPRSAPLAGTLVEAPRAEALPLTLLDGSRVVLDPGARLSLVTLLPKDIRVELLRGAIDLDVTHVEHRELVVVAAGYEIRVLGTRFSVRLDSAERSALEVKVERGRVRITRAGDPGDLRVLGAGEAWSTVLDAGATPPADTAAAEADGGAVVEVPPEPPPSTSAPAAAVVAGAPSAKELWARAEAARDARRFEDEARALNALRTRHRADPRAGLAAFELGRLRQDTLHDPSGAAEAFTDAVVLAPRGPFREDADARRVEALDAAGRRAECQTARTEYLARYESGLHRQRVTTLCASR